MWELPGMHLIIWQPSANKQPPQFYYDTTTLNLGTDPSTYDTVGRFYFARVTVKF